MGHRNWRVGLLAVIAGAALAGCLPQIQQPVTQAPASSPQNAPPRISGSPGSTAVVGSTYVFAPAASDPDGQPLSYSISNKPAWATFSAVTGQLMGAPTSAHLGTVTNIVITVTDGAGASSSLPAFSITVTGAAVTFTGSAALSWTPPGQYTDGSPLQGSELSGYRIYHGTSATALTRIAEVDGATTGFTVGNLGPGTHYFAVTAVALAGAESNFSDIGSKTIM